MNAVYVVAGVAAIAVLGQVITALTFARAQRSVQRQYARERELLVNQLCNVVGRPWAPAPADEWNPELEPVLVSSPEQLPD